MQHFNYNFNLLDRNQFIRHSSEQATISVKHAISWHLLALYLQTIYLDFLIF